MSCHASTLRSPWLRGAYKKGAWVAIIILSKLEAAQTTQVDDVFTFGGSDDPRHAQPYNRYQSRPQYNAWYQGFWDVLAVFGEDRTAYNFEYSLGRLNRAGYERYSEDIRHRGDKILLLAATMST